MIYTQGRYVDVIWFGMTVEEFHRKVFLSSASG